MQKSGWACVLGARPETGFNVRVIEHEYLVSVCFRQVQVRSGVRNASLSPVSDRTAFSFSPVHGRPERLASLLCISSLHPPGQNKRPHTPHHNHSHYRPRKMTSHDTRHRFQAVFRPVNLPKRIEEFWNSRISKHAGDWIQNVRSPSMAFASFLH
jgi:hypothetical protein